jgi:hypothetical protein
MAEVALGILFFWLGLRIAFGRLAAWLAALWLAIGPSFLFRTSLIALADETAFLCSAILFWLAVRCFQPRSADRPRDSLSGCFLLGLASGFGWWMHQGVALVLVPAAWLLLLETETWAAVRQSAKPIDRLFARGERLGWRELSESSLTRVRSWNALLLLWVGVLLLHDLILPSPGSLGPLTLAESAALLVASQLAFELFWGSRTAHRRAVARAWREWKAVAPRVTIFAAGVLLGLSPVVVGRILGWYPVTYGRRIFLLGFDGVPARVAHMLRDGLWRWIGADRSLAATVFVAGTLAALLAMALQRSRGRDVSAKPHGGAPGPRTYAGAVVLFCVLFDAIALRRGGPPHYLTPGVAPAYGFAAAVLVWLASRRSAPRVMVAGRAAALLLAGAFLWSLTAQARASTREILAEPDPRLLLARIQAAGYRICYANYWQAYVLQFIGNEQVRFIPYRSRSRNPHESQWLTQQSEDKCLLMPSGELRRITPEDLSRPAASQPPP